MKLTKKSKDMFKRCMSVVLALVMLVTGVGFVDFTKEINADTESVTLYFIDNTAEEWVKNDNAVIQLVDNTHGHDYYDMNKVDDITWSAVVPATAYNITFNRLNPDKNTQWNSWSAGGRDSNNAYYADGAEYGHWDIVESEEENEEHYFHAGDIVYLDLSGFTSWENDAALMYINFTDASKEDNGGNDVNIDMADRILYNPFLTDYVEENHVYAYIITKDDEGKDILRFWRGNATYLWNCSVTLDYEQYQQGYNCIVVNGWNGSGYLGKKEYEVKIEADRDKDDVPDYLEAVFGLNKYSSDTDHDGLSDYEEVVITETDPLKYDSVQEGIADSTIDLDEDGLSNIEEINFGTNPLAVDSDEDGLTDSDEINIYQTEATMEDTDGDKLNDGDEIALGLNPHLADTNGNGIIDSEEYVEQAVNSDRFDSELYTDNIAEPALQSVSAKGNVNNNIRISEYDGHLKGDERAYVGKIIEIAGADINEGTLSFTLGSAYTIKNYKAGGGNTTNGLLICYNDGQDTFPLETVYNSDTKTLTADISDGGIYFVLDVISWLDTMGIEYEIDDEETTGINTKKAVAKLQKNSSQNNDTSIANIQIKGQTDIVFIIDTTGSMASYIENVKNNINAFVNEIDEAGVKAYFALVDYKDITCDGQYSTNVKKNTDNSNWFKNANDFKEEMAKLNVSGGGDAPETVVDALEMARQLDLRNSSQKFFIVVTDA